MAFTDAMFNRAPATRVKADSKADIAAWAKEMRQKKYRGELSSEMKAFGENVDNMTNEQLRAMLDDLMVKRDELMAKAKEARENQARRDGRKANFKKKLMGLGQKFMNTPGVEVQQDAPWLNRQQAQPSSGMDGYAPNSASGQGNTLAKGMYDVDQTKQNQMNTNSLFAPTGIQRGTYGR